MTGITSFAHAYASQAKSAYPTAKFGMAFKEGFKQQEQELKYYDELTTRLEAMVAPNSPYDVSGKIPSRRAAQVSALVKFGDELLYQDKQDPGKLNVFFETGILPQILERLAQQTEEINRMQSELKTSDSPNGPSPQLEQAKRGLAWMLQDIEKATREYPTDRPEFQNAIQGLYAKGYQFSNWLQLVQETGLAGLSSEQQKALVPQIQALVRQIKKP